MVKKRERNLQIHLLLHCDCGQGVLCQGNRSYCNSKTKMHK